MKILFLLLALSTTTWSFCQNQQPGESGLLNTEVDKFSGDTIIKTSMFKTYGTYHDMVYYLGEKKNGITLFTIWVDRTPTTCFKPGNMAVLLFENGKKDTLFNSYRLNCKGTMQFSSLSGINKFENLSSSRITDIRFITEEGYFDEEVSKSDAITGDRINLANAMKRLVAQ